MREFILELIKVDLTANTPNVAEYRENENVFSERVTASVGQKHSDNDYRLTKH